MKQLIYYINILAYGIFISTIFFTMTVKCIETCDIINIWYKSILFFSTTLCAQRLLIKTVDIFFNKKDFL